MPELIGYLLTLDALFTWAAASLVYKWGLKKATEKASLFFRLTCVSIGTFIFTLIFGNLFIMAELSEMARLDYIIACIISGLSVTLGDLSYYMALKRIDASRAYPLVQLSLVFVYPFAFVFFGEIISPEIVIGATLILSSVFILSTKDKQSKLDNDPKIQDSEKLVSGVLFSIGAAFGWALAILSFNQARIITGEVFLTNFLRVGFAWVTFLIVGIFKREYFEGFKNENRRFRKYYIWIGIAGILSLGFADSLYYKAAEINGLVLTTTFTINTPMVQQILSILILKEKFRPRFIFAVLLIIIGNYIILFL
jgi:drug/metabolite transporter (DMT)-like permease